MNRMMSSLALLTLLLTAGSAFGQDPQPGPEFKRSTHPIMHFSQAWMRMHHRRRKAMPVHRANPAQLASLELPVPLDTKGVNLLTQLNFNACGGQTGWDQGQCGNCWVWGSSAACAIDAGVALGTPQMFSTQWFDSDYYATQGNASACDGGDSSMFAAWYNSYPSFIPWTNTNAGYADSNGPSAPVISASTIGQTPNVPIKGITATRIETTGVSQAQAIANIKSVLDANQAVTMAFWLPSAGWKDFDDAWEANTETTPWAGTDTYNGTTMDSGGGGHLVCIVGYDNTTSAWVALNSWGPTQGRPDGYFEVPMSMGYNDTINYDGQMDIYEFDTFEPVGWGGVVTAPAITTQPASQTLQVGQSAKFSVVASGTTPLAYQWYRNGALITGATYATYTTPATTSADNGATFHVTVGNSAGTATSNTATLTVNTSTVTDLIVNGGFEQGGAGWIAPAGVIGQHGPQEPAHTGTWDAWFGGSTSKPWNTLAQTVTIPATAVSAALSYYLHIDGQQPNGTARNSFVVQVREGNRLVTLATYTLANAANGYQAHTFDLSAYKGQTLQVSFSASEQASAYATSYVLDNVSLKVQ